MSTLTKFARQITLTLALAAVGLAAACAPAASGPVTSALTEAEAAAIGENALAALNAGDYAAWSRDWDEALKSAINEEAFLAYREQVLEAAGQYQETLSIDMSPSPRADSVRWVLTCQFEKAKVRFIMAFPADGKRMNTVMTEPAS